MLMMLDRDGVHKFDGTTNSLTREQAEAVMRYKKGSTYRALTMRFLGIQDQYTGRQLSLCAAQRLYYLSREQLHAMDFDINDPFCRMNVSCWGTDFWWE